MLSSEIKLCNGVNWNKKLEQSLFSTFWGLFETEAESIYFSTWKIGSNNHYMDIHNEWSGNGGEMLSSTTSDHKLKH